MFQTSKYSMRFVNDLTAIMVARDKDSVNYLTGYRLTEFFSQLGFRDSYEYSNGIGIVTEDIGSGLSRSVYTKQRLKLLNENGQLYDTIQLYLSEVDDKETASKLIEEISQAESNQLAVELNNKKTPQMKSNSPNDIAKQMQDKQDIENVLGGLLPDRPTIFISYSWDDDEHKAWVRKLVDSLTISGFNVLFDQYLRKGIDLPLFMLHGIEKSDYVLIIGTPLYKEKSMKSSGGVSFEDCVIRNTLFQNMTTKKFIPCLRKGSFSTSFPLLLTGKNGYDFLNGDFTIQYNDLEHELWGCPTNEKPMIGPIPNYVNQ